ncbi:hypothetical protein FBU59_003167, partial [Linderina macrospora]
MFGSGRKKPSAESPSRPPDQRANYLFTTLYGRRSAQSTASTTPTTTDSASDRSAARRHRPFLPSTLRRAVGAQPTVELVKPSPDVELTRATDIVRPVLGKQGLLSDDLASLRSLKLTQSHPSFTPAQPADSGSDGGVHGSVRSDMVPRQNNGSDIASENDDTYFNDEKDIPFRSNAVEIAMQDDKHELA